MTEMVLEARDLHRRYAQFSGWLRRPVGIIRAVDGVTCALAQGERLGLVGESGCGKTTLAKMLGGLLAPTEGEARLHGTSWASLRGAAWRRARRRAQFIFQDPMSSLNPRLTVEQTLREPLRIHDLAQGAACRARVEELLASVQLPSSYRSRLPRELSGGERQRIGIARALATDPEVIICDEPISSLDVSVGAQILELLRSLSQQRRLALLFISHDLRAVASLCTRVAVMRNGQLLEVAPTDALLAHPAHPYTQLLIRCASLDLDTVEEPPPLGV